jgi:chromosome segregation ATPase
VLDPKFRWSIGFLTQRIVGLFASLIVTNDPIGVMRYRLKEAKAMLQELLNSIAELRGAVDKAYRDRDTYQQELDKAEGRLSAAQKRAEGNRPNGAMMATQANMALRRRRSIESINREIAQGENMIKLLERYAEQSEAYVLDMGDNISFTERERKRLKTAFSAFKAAANILKGKSVGAEMYEEALDRANEDAAMMIGEMKQFISESRGALEGFELDKEGAVEQALKNIEAKSQGSLMLEFQPGMGLPLRCRRLPPRTSTVS